MPMIASYSRKVSSPFEPCLSFLIKKQTFVLGSQMMNYKPTLVLMAGLPCSGKTTLARQLEKALGWPVESKDLFKAALLQTGGKMTDEEAGRVAYELLFAQAEDLIVQKQCSIIFDTSAHRPFILENALRIVRAAGAEMKIIYCVAPRSLRLERLNKRTEANLHYPFMLRMVTTTIEDEAEHFRHLPSNRLSINTQKPIEACLTECLEYIYQDEKVLISQ